MPDVKWTEAPQSVIHTAEMLIDKYHPWLRDARIAFVMRSEAQKQGGFLIHGQTSKVPDKFQAYLDYDYLIWLAEDSYMANSSDWREALIDHELCHCKYGANGWTLRKHDLNDFSIIIARHGFWSDDLQRASHAAETYRQEVLPFRDDGSVTVTGGGRVVTVTPQQLERISAAGGV